MLSQPSNHVYAGPSRPSIINLWTVTLVDLQTPLFPLCASTPLRRSWLSFAVRGLLFTVALLL